MLACIYFVTVGPTIDGPDPCLSSQAHRAIDTIRTKLPPRPDLIVRGEGRRHKEVLERLRFHHVSTVIVDPGFGLASFQGKGDELYLANGNKPAQDTEPEVGVGNEQGFKWRALHALSHLQSLRHQRAIVAIMDPDILRIGRPQLYCWGEKTFGEQIPVVRADIVYRMQRDDRRRWLGIEIVQNYQDGWGSS